MNDFLTPSSSGPSSYLAPSADAAEDKILGYLREAVQTGNDYLRSQKGYTDVDEAVELLSGGENEALSKHLSHLTLNFAKRDIDEIVSTLSNIRMLPEFKTDNRLYDTQRNVLNKMHQAWYQSTYADRAIKRALQYAATGGVGYLYPQWTKRFWNRGRGDISLGVLGPRDVLPNQMGRDHDLQKCYSVSIKHEMPVAEALARFPQFADQIYASKQSPSWLRRGIERVQKYLSPVLNAGYMDHHPEDGEVDYPIINLYYHYILDLSVNQTTGTVPMGDPGTKWYYEVPALDSDIATGSYDSATGAMLYRKATYEDCLLYPLRRLIISLDTTRILYDGPSYWWHGKVPAIPFRLDKWPWTYLGFSLIRDIKSPQQSITRLGRAIDDSANARLDPPLGYDENLMSKGLVERLNPRKPGQRVRMNLQMGDPTKPLLPAEYYNIPPYVFEFWKSLADSIPSLIGSRDIAALAKAKQVPAGDTLEKLMEMAGPRTTDKSREMEMSVGELADQWKALAFEFYDLPRRVQILGPDGVGEHDFDYDPCNMIPSHMPDEYELIKQGKMAASAPSRLGLVARARAHIDSFYTFVHPHSLHYITQMSQRLMLMQLFIRGFPIDPWTVAESMDIANFGRPPLPPGSEGSVMEKWFAWMQIQAKLHEGQPQPQQRGRKPSGQTPPTMTPKNGGTRQVVRESPR